MPNLKDTLKICEFLNKLRDLEKQIRIRKNIFTAIFINLNEFNSTNIEFNVKKWIIRMVNSELMRAIISKLSRKNSMNHLLGKADQCKGIVGIFGSSFSKYIF